MGRELADLSVSETTQAFWSTETTVPAGFCSAERKILAREE